MNRAPVGPPFEAPILHLVPRSRKKRDLPAEVVHALDREQRDYVASLRALAALLHREGENTQDAILGRIFESELNQLAMLGGEMSTVLRLEADAPGPAGRIDLSRALEGAVRRSGRPALVRLTGATPVHGHPAVITQLVGSVLAYAERIAESTVTATAEMKRGCGVVIVRAPVATSPRANGRVTLLHRIARAEGGSLRIHRSDGEVRLRLAFPAA